MNWQAFGNAVYAHRQAVGFPSLRDLGDQLGVSAPTLSRVERGERCDVETFAALCRWMRADANEWLGIREPRPVATSLVADELERLARRLRGAE